MKTFTDYIQTETKRIRSGRKDLDGENAQEIIDQNAPFEWKPTHPTQKSILLIHGLLDSAFCMRDLGEYFLKQGFLVRSILLPGHGTQPAELIDTSYVDWITCVDREIKHLKNETEQTFVLGFSTGAALAIHYALKNPDDLAGLFLISPLVKIKSRMAPLSGLMRLVGKIYKPAAWLAKSPETDAVKYSSFPYNAGYQTYLLSKLIQHQIIKTPIQMVLSEDDETIDAKAALQFFKKQNNDKNCLLFYTNKPKTFDNPTISPRKAALPEERILNISHICLPIHPNNPHYGKKNQSSKHVLGAINEAEKRLGTKRIKRLSYHPYFEEMTAYFTDFLKQL